MTNGASCMSDTSEYILLATRTCKAPNHVLPAAPHDSHALVPEPALLRSTYTVLWKCI